MAHGTGQGDDAPAIPLTPYQPFGTRWLEFTVNAQKLTVGTKVQQGAVKRTAAELAVTLDNADGVLDPGWTAYFT